MSRFNEWIEKIDIRKVKKLQVNPDNKTFTVFIEHGKIVREFIFGPYTNFERLRKDVNRTRKKWLSICLDPSLERHS